MEFKGSDHHAQIQKSTPQRTGGVYCRTRTVPAFFTVSMAGKKHKMSFHQATAADGKRYVPC